MPKFKVRLIGTLKFDRVIELYATNEDDACALAEEQLRDATQLGDEVDVEEVYIEDQDDSKYEISLKVTGGGGE
jgi:hypothetical protein